MLDLLQVWNRLPPLQPSNNTTSSRAYPENTNPRAIAFDQNTAQSSFEFKTAPKIKFIKSSTTLESADFYDDLPGITLTPDEEAARLLVVEQQQARNPHFYDGDQMLITGVLYDEDSNTLYLEAKKVPYSFTVALNNKKFPEDSHLYTLKLFKTGVLAPLITRDDMMLLLERKALGLRSVPAGFLETDPQEKRLNFTDTKNLVSETANSEIKEEIAGINKTDTLRFEYSMPEVTAISFRQTNTLPMGTIEFVAPAYADCHSSYLQQDVVPQNLAKDAREHTTRNDLIPLDSRKREQLLRVLLTGPDILPGRSLYLPLTISAARLVNPTCTDALPCGIPGNASRVLPLSMFTARPERLLGAENTETEDDEETSAFECH